MVADVRLKVRMRLRVVLEAIRKDARPGGVLLQAYQVAKVSPIVNQALRKHYREWVAREFPGCKIEVTRKNVYIYLPDSYGAGRAPVMEPLPVSLVVVFNPPSEAGF